jgi:hypothetical protein
MCCGCFFSQFFQAQTSNLKKNIPHMTSFAMPSFAMPSLPSPDAPFCKCDDPNCPAGPLMRKMNEMPTDGEAWEIENVSGYTMATTAAVSRTARISSRRSAA